MSTKNLSRTIIEGGRRPYNKWDRRYSNSEERAGVRNFLKKVVTEEDGGDALVPKHRRHVYKEFNDKGGPVYKWICSQVGRKWDDVHSELKEKFDTRSLAGQHIVYGHLLGSVYQTGELLSRFGRKVDPERDHYVDDNGILRGPKSQPRRFWRNQTEEYEKKKYPSENEVLDWLNGRKIEKVGTVYFWMTPIGSALSSLVTEGAFESAVRPDKVEEVKPIGAFETHTGYAGRVYTRYFDTSRKTYRHYWYRYWRQDRKLTRDELAFMETIRRDKLNYMVFVPVLKKKK